MLNKYDYLVYVLPLMASLVKKKKGNRLYYYLVESARVDDQPRIVHQAPPKNSLHSSSKALPLSPSPPPCVTSVCPVPCGWRQNSPACGPCWNPCGRLRVPDPVRLTIFCSRPFTASVIPVRRRKSATGKIGRAHV